jgi:hypothetical protein
MKVINNSRITGTPTDPIINKNHYYQKFETVISPTSGVAP